MKPLTNKTILITGAARRIGREVALACAHAGASVIIHHAHSDLAAEKTAEKIREVGGDAHIIKADFAHPQEALEIISKGLDGVKNLYGLINNASIFEPVDFFQTTLETWQMHMDINLCMPFLLCQVFARKLAGKAGRIVNMLDWRAMRPGRDHFPYTISKSGLAAMTRALALVLAPNICVNGLALGAILPPADGENSDDNIIKPVPMARWAEMQEVTAAILFFLSGPQYITGEILHLDGGRHLV